MRSAAPRPDEPEPGPEDLDAKAARLLDAHLALIQKADTLLGSWRAACPSDSAAVPVLQDLITETISAGMHLEEMRQDMARFTATAGALSAAFEAGRACERAAAQAPGPLPVPGPRHARRRLALVKGGTLAAFTGAAAKGASWAAHHAVAATAVGVATVATTAMLVPGSPVSPLGGGPAPTSSPAPAGAGPVTAVPIAVMGPSHLAAAVTRPKAATVTAGPMATMPIPPVADTPSPSDPGQQQGPGWQPPVVSLTAAPLTVDLSAAPLGTVVLTADGETRWHAWCSADVTIGDDSGSRSGTVDPADPVNLTIAPAPAQDGQVAATCHIWPGDLQVAVTLPPPAPASPSPSASPSSGVPSASASP